MNVESKVFNNEVVYIHNTTTNKSFIDMKYYLKSRGIQNNDFFLFIYDRGLIGVDPFDPNLSNNMKTRILIEIRRNYFYYLREILRLPSQGASAGHGVRYQLHRGNLAMNFLLNLNYNAYVILPRQFGKTTTALCYYLWVYNFRTTNSEITFVHKDHSGSKKNLRDLKAIRDLLPTWLRMDSAVNQEGKKLKVPNTVVNIQHPFNNNKITTLPSARTKDSANNVARGLTTPNQYYDEFAFMPYNREVYLAAAPAFSRASQNAKQNFAPHGMLITTTPGDMLTDSGQYAYDMLNNATPWMEEYYDMTKEQLDGLAMSNTKSAFFSVVYSYQQLGAGMDYFNRSIKELNNDWVAIKREILLNWSDSVTNCPFSQEDLDKIKQYNRDPIRTVFFGKFNQYQMNIYEDIDLQYPPIIGVDVAGATFNDSSAITIIDSRTTHVCATLNCNFIPYDDLADIIYQLCTKFMPNAVVNVERNGVTLNLYYYNSSLTCLSL